MAKSNQKLVCILGSRLVKNDSRLEKQRASLIDRGYRVEMIGWGEGVTKDAGAMLNATHLDTQFLRQTLQPLARAALMAANKPQDLSGAVANAHARRITLLMRLISLKPHAVVASDPETLEVASWLKAWFGFKLVYDAHEYYAEEVLGDAPRAAAVHKIHKKASRQIDTFITVNELIAGLYAADYPAFPKAQMLRNAASARPKSVYDGRLHDHVSRHRDTKILLHQGGLMAMRGLLPLAKAASQLPENWHVVFMGSGDLGSQISDLGGERCSVIAPQPWQELPKWTSGAALGAILYEPLGANQINCSPNKLWEFPSANVPILASPLPYLAHQIDAWGLGWTCNIEPNAIANCVRDIKDYKLFAAQANCERFSQTMTWENEVQVLIKAVS